MIEANSSPSLECSSALDRNIKSQLIKHVIELLDPIDINWESLKKLLEKHAKESSSLRKDSMACLHKDRFARQLEVRCI